jgi:hypothetical protein
MFFKIKCMLKLSIVILSFLIVPSLQLYIEMCQLGQEKCSCSFSSFTNMIQVDCSSSTIQTVNLLDLDKDLNVSNDDQKDIELIIRNKYFYKNLYGISNRTFNYSINPNLDLIKTLTLTKNTFLNHSSQRIISSNSFELRSLVKLSMNENDLVAIDPLWFNINANIKILNLSSNLLKIIKNDKFFSLNNLETLYLYSNEIEILEVNSFRGLDNLKFIYIQTRFEYFN